MNFPVLEQASFIQGNPIDLEEMPSLIASKEFDPRKFDPISSLFSIAFAGAGKKQIRFRINEETDHIVGIKVPSLDKYTMMEDVKDLQISFVEILKCMEIFSQLFPIENLNSEEKEGVKNILHYVRKGLKISSFYEEKNPSLQGDLKASKEKKQLLDLHTRMQPYFTYYQMDMAQDSSLLCSSGGCSTANCKVEPELMTSELVRALEPNKRKREQVIIQYVFGCVWVKAGIPRLAKELNLINTHMRSLSLPQEIIKMECALPMSGLSHSKLLMMHVVSLVESFARLIKACRTATCLAYVKLYRT